MQNIFFPFKKWLFSQYCDSNIGLFSIALHLVIALPTLQEQKLLLLISLLKFCMSFVDWFMASFLYCFPCSCCSVTLLKAPAKSNGNLFDITFKLRKSDNYCYCDSWKSDYFRKRDIKKKQRTDTKKDAKRIKSDN